MSTVAKISPLLKIQYVGKIEEMLPDHWHFERSLTPSHHGMDLSIPTGNKIIFPFGGVITHKFYDKKGGKTLYIMDDNKIQWRFLHLSKQHGYLGEKILPYTLIGQTGNTGASTSGPHLHIEMRYNGDLIDPKILLSK